MKSWEGRSCNAKTIEGSGAGVMFYGEKGSLLLQGGDSYTIFDLDDNIIKEEKVEQKIDTSNLVNPSKNLDALHIRNFFDGIRDGRSILNANIEAEHKSTLLVQLGNIAQRVGRSLDINPENGHILRDKEAMKYWSRTYEKGWEMKLLLYIWLW